MSSSARLAAGTSAPDRRGGAVALAGGAACAALLVFNVAAGLSRPLEVAAPPGYRYWEDLRVALREYRSAAPPVARPRARRAASGEFEAARREIERLGLRPWEFWKTVDERAFPRYEEAAIERLEDAGRARLLAWAFRGLGGVAPYALFWFAPLAAVPVMIWITWEMARAGHALAGAAFAALAASSGFLVDALPLAYSAMGFYLVGALLLVAWAAYAVARPSLTARGLLIRALVCGSVLAPCVVCRGSTPLLLPGFLLALLLAGRRLSHARRGAVVALAAALLMAPPLLARSLGGHEHWVTMWEGLGDFDREKGHVWSDAAAKRLAQSRGFDHFLDPGAQAMFRAETLRSIRGDPAWYAGILVRRFLVTTTQWKLWPRGTVRPSTHPNQGALDGYYTLTRGADVFTLGRRATLELPVPALLAGPVLLAGHALWRLTGRGPGGTRYPSPTALGVVACLAAGTLVLPVLISTAGALEPQAAALPWLLAWGFAVEGSARWLAGRASARRAGPRLG